MGELGGVWAEGGEGSHDLGRVLSAIAVGVDTGREGERSSNHRVTHFCWLSSFWNDLGIGGLKESGVGGKY